MNSQQSVLKIFDLEKQFTLRFCIVNLSLKNLNQKTLPTLNELLTLSKYLMNTPNQTRAKIIIHIAIMHLIQIY